ncbi:MAG: hypothetical protein EOP48_33195 [Sphingobacteriales bacterium]|nr:MAG: hypothetical protein EOP48_33195 [Sphingobacteriales bacterium]
MKVKDALRYYYEKYANQYPEICDDLMHLNEIRNNVHISILDKHEFESTDYCFATYNKAIKVLLFLKEHQLRIMEEFNSKRLRGCLIAF